jgi:2-aminoadipate transaminase
MGASAIREILKVVSQPGMVSLAGGIPAPEAFPMKILDKLCSKVIKKYGSQAFQYSATEGFMPLREALVKYLKKENINTTCEEVLISSGSQGMLDGLGKILISEGDKVAVEAPTYLGALQAFNPYQPQYVSIETDEQGFIPSSLEKVLKKQKIKFIYLVPTFQNPTGRTIPLDRRKAIAKLIIKYKTLLVEDDPYAALRYRGKKVASIKSLAPDNVVYLGTLSKVFAPGLRIGFSVAPKQISHWLTLAKQGVDLHSSTFNQALAAEYLSAGHLQKQIPKILKVYEPRQKAMLRALEKYFPKTFKWSKPEGGMFIWVAGPKGMDMEKIYWQAVKKKVAFVPGKFFYTEPKQGLETMRLNYSMSDEKTIDQAIKTLSEVIKKN